MGNLRTLLLMFAATIVSMHAEDFTLSGTVVDDAESPLEGVTVRLLDGNITATTNSSGNYTISGQSSVAPSVGSASIVNLVSISRNRLQVTITESGRAQASIYSLQGRLLKSSTLTGSAGDVKSMELNTISQGMCIYFVTSGPHVSQGKLVHYGSLYNLINVKNSVTTVNEVRCAKSQTASVIDRLIFTKDGYASRIIGLASLNGEVDVAMAALTAVVDTSGYFTERDVEQDADLSDAVFYTLASGQEITITAKGVYVFSGSATDASIIVDAPDSVKVQLVLDGVEVTNGNAPVVYVKSADKVYITTTEGSTNTMTCTGAANVEVNGTDSTFLDGVIFSKDDLVLNGLGTLTVVSGQTHGIVTKDDLKITGGTLAVTAAKNGLKANDSVRMASGVITVDAGTDALHCENDDDAALGYVYISGGDLTIGSDDEGIQASGDIRIDAGTITITESGKGIEGSYIEINNGILDITSSGHGIKAIDSIHVVDGDITIDAGSDGIHAESDLSTASGSIRISGGTITVTARDDGIRATTILRIDGGTIDVQSSTEGLEGTYLLINDGDITVNATDDGVNATEKSNAYSVLIEVTGGTMHVTVAGNDVDGFDSNGRIILTGGTIYVVCPTDGPSGAFDADSGITLDGATVYINGVQTTSFGGH